MDFRQQFLSGCLPEVLESSTGLIVSREGGEGAVCGAYCGSHFVIGRWIMIEVECIEKT